MTETNGHMWKLRWFGVAPVHVNVAFKVGLKQVGYHAMIRLGDIDWMITDITRQGRFFGIHMAGNAASLVNRRVRHVEGCS